MAGIACSAGSTDMRTESSAASSMREPAGTSRLVTSTELRSPALVTRTAAPIPQTRMRTMPNAAEGVFRLL